MGGILHVKCTLRQASERALDAVVVDFFGGDLNLGGGGLWVGYDDLVGGSVL